MVSSRVEEAKDAHVWFTFSAEKMVQAAAVLLRIYKNKRMSYLRLLKLLYIADRESLQETGRPIVGSEPVAMQKGLLDSHIYNLIRGNAKDSVWSAFIRTEGYYVRLLGDPGDLKLSAYEARKLREVTLRYVKVDRFKLADYTHKFAEYKDPGNSSILIAHEELINAVGRSADKDDILADAREKAYADQLFGR